MKKCFLMLFVTIAFLNSYSQHYGFAICFTNSVKYYSEVIDLSKLNCKPAQTQFGKATKVQTYSQCLDAWMTKQLKPKGTELYGLFSVVRTENKYANCTGDQESCFLTKSQAEAMKKSYMENDRANRQPNAEL